MYLLHEYGLCHNFHQPFRQNNTLPCIHQTIATFASLVIILPCRYSYMTFQDHGNEILVVGFLTLQKRCCDRMNLWMNFVNQMVIPFLYPLQSRLVSYKQCS